MKLICVILSFMVGILWIRIEQLEDRTEALKNHSTLYTKATTEVLMSHAESLRMLTEITIKIAKRGSDGDRKEL